MSGRCSACDRKRQQDYNARRGPDLYGSYWRELRNFYISAHPFCADPFKDHERAGKRFVLAAEVDHIKPLVDGGTHDTDNLQSLCIRCHSRKTALENGGFGNKRKAL